MAERENNCYKCDYENVHRMNMIGPFFLSLYIILTLINLAVCACVRACAGMALIGYSRSNTGLETENTEKEYLCWFG